MNNLPKVVAQQRRGRASNPRLLDRKSDAIPLSHRATQGEDIIMFTRFDRTHERDRRTDGRIDRHA